MECDKCRRSGLGEERDRGGPGHLTIWLSRSCKERPAIFRDDNLDSRERREREESHLYILSLNSTIRAVWWCCEIIKKMNAEYILNHISDIFVYLNISSYLLASTADRCSLSSMKFPKLTLGIPVCKKTLRKLTQKHFRKSVKTNNNKYTCCQANIIAECFLCCLLMVSSPQWGGLWFAAIVFKHNLHITFSAL